MHPGLGLVVSIFSDLGMLHRTDIPWIVLGPTGYCLRCLRQLLFGHGKSMQKQRFEIRFVLRSVHLILLLYISVLNKQNPRHFWQLARIIAFWSLGTRRWKRETCRKEAKRLDREISRSGFCRFLFQTTRV